MDLVIRPYDERDEGGVVDLWRTVFPDAPPWNPPAGDIRRKLAVQRDLFLVATLNEHLVGTTMAGYDGHRGWLYYVAVAPEARGHGIGRALVADAEQRLREMGCPKINLQVRATNLAVLAFYDRLGFAVEHNISLGKRLGDDAAER